MRILFVCSIYLPLTGGCQDPINQVGQRFVDEGHEVHVLTKRWPDDLPETEVINGIVVHRVTSPLLPSEFSETTEPVGRLIREHPPDAVHAIGLRRPLPAYALMIARLCGAPVVLTIGGWDIPDPRDPEPEKVWLTGQEFVPQSMQQADLVTAASADLARLTESAMPELAPVEATYVGIDYAFFAEAAPYPHPRPYLLSLRRLEASKGVDRLVRAFATVAAEIPGHDLVIAGDGAERGKLAALADELGVRDRVVFLGEVQLDAAASLLRGASLTAVPSIAEGGGLVNVEAQAAGCPVIATRTGGITEYLQGEGGAHFIDVPDPDSLAEGILRLLRDTDYRERLVAVGREKAHRFDWASLADDYYDLYRRAQHKAPLTEFEPWSPLTRLLYEEFRAHRDRVAPATEAWESEHRRERDVLAAAPEHFRRLGQGARRWYYAGVVAGRDGDALNEAADRVWRAFRDTAPEAVNTALAEAAEWGRFDFEEVATYVALQTDTHELGTTR